MVSALVNSLRLNLKLVETRVEAINKLAGKTITPLEEKYYVETYPALACCTTAEDGQALPTADDLLDGDVMQSNDWYMAALELNPYLFSASEEQQPAEEVKKKRVRSRRHLQPTE